MKSRDLGFNGGCEHGFYLAAANFLNISHRFFFDGGQAAANISFGRLRAEQIDALALDEIGVVVKNAAKILLDGGTDTARFGDILAAGQFARFAKNQRCTALNQALESASDSGA